MNRTKKKQTHRYREQTSGYQWGRGNKWVGEWEVQTFGCKIGYKDILYNTGDIGNILNNCKWTVTFKIVFKKINKWAQQQNGGNR